MTIAAFLPVFNEEGRIGDALSSLMWCDKIILIDKNSSDRTLEIAKSYGEKIEIHSIENKEAYDSSEWLIFLNNCDCEWVILFTASDVIHPYLVDDIIKFIRKDDKEIDILNIPFRRYVLGLETERSPWYTELSPKIVRKSSIVINQEGVHNAAQFVGKKLNLPNHHQYCMYHLTHETVDKMMSGHLRYWKGESNATDLNLRRSALTVMKELLKIVFLKRTLFMGANGIALVFSYLSYFMMSYVYKWERKKSNSKEIYTEIKRDINSYWKIKNESEIDIN